MGRAVKPRRFRALAVMQPTTALSASSSIGAPVDVGAHPTHFPSGWDNVDNITGLGQPLPIMALTLVEGTDFPFYTRETEDGSQPRGRYRRADVRSVVQPAVPGVPLTLLSPPDETVVALAGEVYDGPSAADKFKRRKRRQQITADWPTMFDASRFAFLPAGAYLDDACRIFSEIQRHFLENVIDEGVTWSLWSRAEVQASYDYRVALFLEQTRLIRERRTLTASANVSEYALPADTVAVTRVAFNNVVLTRADEWAMDHGVVGWEQTPDTPYAYIEDASAGTLTIQLVPPPSTGGTISLIIVPTATTTRSCQPTPVPAVFSWGIKWGVVADLLGKEGEANDPVRAAYAEGRFSDCVEIAKMWIDGKGR